MLRMFWNSRSALSAEQNKLDAISNNIANIGTTGYKKVDVSFKDLMSEELDKRGYPFTSDKVKQATLTTGSGVKNGEWLSDNKQGQLTNTGVTTDLAIDGKGYFRVTMPDGTKAYTRDGAFSVDGSGNVLDSKGDKLDITFFGSPVKLSADTLSVDENGYLFDKNNRIGQIEIYNSVGNNSMNSIGGNLFAPSGEATVYKETDYNIKQGFLENSNVDLASEMTDMLVTQRAFELNSKSLKNADEMWNMANNLRR